ncbi:unnamed protein product [Blepharisma stoltei]|uniref:Succinate--CoA ligase [ADP-forming] subunit beta, mitochondrial n=1 Tax=Blepharisma stoltei TaxID=1481888 RepID=A0AAU9KFE8_9CILI|nr:unnamed protein product [Blepharisma stoltei]
MAFRGLFKAPFRRYSLHEFQSKKLLHDSGVKVQRGTTADTATDSELAAASLRSPYIVKANVQVGGRGLGTLSSGLKGGVQFCKTPQEVGKVASQMIGYQLVTKQTTAEGVPVKSLMILEEVDIKRQLYLAFVLDRQIGGPAVIYSQDGGMDIEAVAHNNPSSVHVKPIDIHRGFSEAEALEITRELQLSDKEAAQGAKDIVRLYELFKQKDALQLEINPWATTPTEEMYCVDAKVTIDDNAIFRHKDIIAFREQAETFSKEDSVEREAEKSGLNYVGMTGNIGCMVNGAGLAMATMDIIKLYGGAPANFLDVGGGANEKQIFKAFDILFSHSHVKSIFVNIFGGIVRCDLIAEMLIKAKNQLGFPCPLVVRLQGNNADVAQRMIEEERDEKLHSEFNMENAAKLAVSYANR